MGGGGSASRPGGTGTETPTTATVNNSNFPAFMPGERDRLLDQLSYGYGSQVAENMPMDYYRDMSVPQILQPGDIAALLQQRGLTPAANSSPATKRPMDTTGPVVDPPIGQGGDGRYFNAPQAASGAPTAVEWWNNLR